MVKIEKYCEFLKESFVNLRCHKFIFPSKNAFGFTLSNGSSILFSLDNREPMVYKLKSSNGYEGFESDIFIDQFKKTFSGAIITNIEQVNNDKIIKISFKNTDAYYEKHYYNVYFEMITFHPNLIVVNEDGQIIFAHKETDLTAKRIVCKNIKYFPPENLTIQDDNIDISDILLKKNNDFENLLPILHNKDKSKEIDTYLKKRIKSLEKKIEKLILEIEKSKSNLVYKDAADYLSAMRDEASNWQEFEYDGRIFKLNNELNLNGNIQRFYKLYKKAKASIIPIEEQISKAKEEINYLTDVKSSLTNLADNELQELKIELKLRDYKKKFTFKGKRRITIKKIVNGQTTFLFGSNAFQNEYVTFELASKDCEWFHIIGTSGAHIIIKKDSPATKEDILFACELCVYLNKNLDGDVMHSKRKYLSKGSFPGQVNVKQYETIHINKIRESTFETFKKINVISYILK